MFWSHRFLEPLFRSTKGKPQQSNYVWGCLDTDLDMFELGRPSYKVYAGFTGAWTPSDGRWLAYVLILLY